MPNDDLHNDTQTLAISAGAVIARSVMQHAPINDGDEITPHMANQLTEAFMTAIGEAICHIINAGSERDAVNEDEALRAAIFRQCDDWRRKEPTNA